MKKLNKDYSQIGSNKSFGFTFSIFFLIIGIWLISSANNFWWFFIISLIFFLLGLLNSSLLTLPNILWAKFGILLGKIFSPIILILIFFLTVVPVGLIMKLIGKDLLELKFNKANSYWKKRLINLNSMRKQF